MSKNTRNRILLTALAALLLVAVAVGGTMAWLVDKTENVVNTFTTSNINIDLDEVQENRSFKMVPGATIAKQPYVTVKADSEACYVFVKVTAENTDKYIDYDIDTGIWSPLNNVNNVWYKQLDATTADTNYDILLNDSVTVLDTVTNTDMDAAKANPPKLTFTAYACQVANLTDQDKDEDVDIYDAWKLAQDASVYAPTTTTTP